MGCNEISLPFYFFNEIVKVKIPERCFGGILELKVPHSVENEAIAIENSLMNPVGSLPLVSIVNKGDRIIIIIPDRTRPMPLRLILKILVTNLLNCNISQDNILIMIANGTHRAMTQHEIEEEVGEEIIRKIKIVNHNWRDHTNLIDLGYTDSGIPIHVNREVYEADKLIGIGLVKPHQIAGWSGGAKCIQPGVCGKETTEKTHWAFANIPKKMIIGNIEAQPRIEMEKVARKVGLDFIINAVTSQKKKLSYICSGDFIEAHRNCVKHAIPFYTMEFNQQADIVICGSGTWASNLWLAAGTASYADLFLRDSGTLIILAASPEGLEPEHLVIGEYGFRGYEEISELVNQRKITDLVAAAHMTQLGDMISKRGIECIIVSDGISEKQAKKLKLSYAKSPKDAVKIALKKHGVAGTTIYAMPGLLPGGILPKKNE